MLCPDLEVHVWEKHLFKYNKENDHCPLLWNLSLGKVGTRCSAADLHAAPPLKCSKSFTQQLSRQTLGTWEVQRRQMVC